MVMTMKKIIRTYSELIKLETFEERFRYLELSGTVGVETFGFDRYLNQTFYTSDEWKSLRNKIIVRDNGCDLGVPGCDIHTVILIHHMNPISVKDVLSHSDFLVNPEYLITTRLSTHNGIHYGDDSVLKNYSVIERKPGDTCPWR